MPRQPFHLVELSPWPLFASIGAFLITTGLAAWFHNYTPLPLIMGLLLTTLTAVQWWRDIVREATFMGFHTSPVISGMKWGMMLFITSEVFFFFAFFWAFFHSSLAPTQELGCTWPPSGVTPLDPLSVPLLNTAVLLASGASVTWAHHSLTRARRLNATVALLITVTLGGYFTALQLSEYMATSFSIADSVYGATFFVATGFHGLHVIIGSIFLFTTLLRLIFHHFSQNHHFGFEAAAWYWHFVDVIWIFLYLSIYWWGS